MIGALIICTALRNAGMEVIYPRLFCTPEQVTNIAIQEDVDIVAMSLLNGPYDTFSTSPDIVEKKGGKDILVTGGE